MHDKPITYGINKIIKLISISKLLSQKLFPFNVFLAKYHKYNDKVIGI